MTIFKLFSILVVCWTIALSFLIFGAIYSQIFKFIGFIGLIVLFVPTFAIFMVCILKFVCYLVDIFFFSN